MTNQTTDQDDKLTDSVPELIVDPEQITTRLAEENANLEQMHNKLNAAVDQRSAISLTKQLKDNDE